MNWPMAGMKNPGHCGVAAIYEGGSGVVATNTNMGQNCLDLPKTLFQSLTFQLKIKEAMHIGWGKTRFKQVT